MKTKFNLNSTKEMSILFLLITILIGNTLLAQDYSYRKKLAEKNKELEENLKLSSPNNNIDYTKPFKIAGYGVPGAKIEVVIKTFYNGGDKSKPLLVPKGKQNPYEYQVYFATVDANGSWKLAEPVMVRFRDGATKRKIQIILGQSKGAYKATKPLIKLINIDKTY